MMYGMVLLKMNLAGKVVLVTGGASGIGAACVEEILKNNAKGVVIADIANGEELAKDFSNKYGDDRVIYVKTDTSSKESFKDAFEETVKSFNNIDVLVNCAGLFNEVNWERVIQVNLIGTTYGCLLAINEYFPKYKSTNESYIINIASVAGLIPITMCPHYASSKHGIIGLTRSLGTNKIITDQGIYVVGLCPGGTDTPMSALDESVFVYKELVKEEIAQFPSQKPDVVARSVIDLLQKSNSGSIWMINDGVLSKVDLPAWSNSRRSLIT